MALIVRIKELRTAKGWTQAELADAAGVTRATVNRLENGKPASIDFAVLDRLADALKVDPGFLIVREKGRRGRG